uniref:Uncharacterized protein n=1 Tax=Moniliophthora roreri TaxID=221103 RepID=A0A0W0G2T8_MONRR
MGLDWHPTGRGTNRKASFHPGLSNHAHGLSQRIGTAFSQAMYIFSILRLLNKKTTLTAEMWVYFEEAKNLCAGVGLDKPRGDGWSRLMVVIRKVVEAATKPQENQDPKYLSHTRPSYLDTNADMKRKAAEIRRPYFSQAVTIIRMCEAPAQVLDIQVDQVAAEKEIELLVSATAALLAAINAASGISKTSSPRKWRALPSSLSQRRLHCGFALRLPSATKRDEEHLALFEKRVRMVAEYENSRWSKTIAIRLKLVQKQVLVNGKSKSLRLYHVSPPIRDIFAMVFLFLLSDLDEIPSDTTLQTLLPMEASSNTRFHGRIANLNSYFASVRMILCGCIRSP